MPWPKMNGVMGDAWTENSRNPNSSQAGTGLDAGDIPAFL